MNWTIIKVYAGIVGSAVLTFLLQRALIPDADQLLRSVRSEVTAAAISERLASTTRPVGTETRLAAAATRPSVDDSVAAMVKGTPRTSLHSQGPVLRSLAGLSIAVVVALALAQASHA